MDYASLILAASKSAHIANRVLLNEKISSIKKAGASSLQCVFDFDATISKAFHNGKKVFFQNTKKAFFLSLYFPNFSKLFICKDSMIVKLVF